MREGGNRIIETRRQNIEDPMSAFVKSKAKARMEKYARVEHLKALMEEIREEERLRKILKKETKAYNERNKRSRDDKSDSKVSKKAGKSEHRDRKKSKH